MQEYSQLHAAHKQYQAYQDPTQSTDTGAGDGDGEGRGEEDLLLQGVTYGMTAPALLAAADTASIQ